MPSVQKMKVDYTVEEMQKLLDSPLCQNRITPITVVDLAATGGFYLTDSPERSFVLLHSMIEERKKETHYWTLYYRDQNSIYFFDTSGRPESFDFVSFLRSNKTKFESESFQFWVCASWFAYDPYQQTLTEDGLSEYGITGALCFELARSFASVRRAINLVEKNSEEIIGNKRPWSILSNGSQAHTVKCFDLSRQSLSENLKSLLVPKQVKEIDHFAANRMAALRDITTAQNAVLLPHTSIVASALPTFLKIEEGDIPREAESGIIIFENGSSIPPTAALPRATELLVTGDQFKHNMVIEELPLNEPGPVQEEFQVAIQSEMNKANATITTLMTQLQELRRVVETSERQRQLETRELELLKQEFQKLSNTQAQIIAQQNLKIQQLEQGSIVPRQESEVQRSTRSIPCKTDQMLKQIRGYTFVDDEEDSKEDDAYHKTPLRQVRANQPSFLHLSVPQTFFNPSPAPVSKPPKDFRQKVDNGSELDNLSSALNLSERYSDQEWRSAEALFNELQKISGGADLQGPLF